MSEYSDLRDKFHNSTAELYPGVRYPEVCWLFDVVLGIDPRTIAEAPITKKHYKVFVKDENGKLIRSLQITRKFDPKQAKMVREWWPLIPEGIKSDGLQ